MVFARVHGGLPDDTPWLVRAVLRSRAFLIVTLAVTVILGAVAAGSPEWLLRFDEPVSEWIRRSGGQLSFAKLVTQLGSPNLAAAVAFVGIVVLWRRCRASAITLGILVASAFAADILLKLIVDRTRPPNPAIDTALGSFPSGHVIHAVVIFGLVPILLWALTNRRVFLQLGFVLFTVVVAAVAVSRVRLGAHWPSDVITSFFIGASLLLAAEQLLTSVWASDRCASLGHHPPHPPQQNRDRPEDRYRLFRGQRVGPCRIHNSKIVRSIPTGLNQIQWPKRRCGLSDRAGVR
jgi:membrane-associated phospholipid phosphatase